jgi:hypothetical protein
MGKPYSKIGSSRDMGLTGAGKGDKTRVSDVKAFRRNFDEINWGAGKKLVRRLIQKLSQK